MSKNKFFRRSDWIASWITFVIALIVYTITLQPTLGLEDSGELIVASDYLGVPHPPGYPSWTLLTWLFQWIFHGVTFHGHPNPAWAVNFFSAFSGAGACGVLALLISRSGMDLLRSMAKESNLLGERTESLFCAVAGISGGLLLAFGHGMWSQSVIAEVYSLNIFFQSLVLVFLYRWLAESDNPKWMFLCAFTFGLGCTNHQTLMFMGLAIGIAVLFKDLHLFRDFVIVGLFFGIMMGANLMATEPEWQWVSGPENKGFWIWTIYAVLVPLIATFTLKNGKIVGPTVLLVLIGAAFYFYMPISSDQNPPINWGYPRTWQGFMHAIGRKQYEQVKLAQVLDDPAHFIHLCELFFLDLRSQYLPLVLTGFLPFATWRYKRFNASLAAIAMFLIAGTLFTAGTLVSFHASESVVLAKTINMATIPFMAGLFALSGIGFGISVSNFIESARKRIVEFTRGGNFGFHSALTAIIIIGAAAILVLGLVYIDIKLLINLIQHGAEQSFDDNLIILLTIILPPVFIAGTFLLKPWNKTGLSYDVSEFGQHWFITTIVAFVSVSLLFIILQNPKTDIQTLFIGRVQYIQSHAIYAIWIGYGLLLMMAYIDALLKNLAVVRIAIIAGVLILPAFLIVKNRIDPTQQKIYGSADQGGHDFGWQFGNWQLQGVKGIEEDLHAWYKNDPSEFERVWASYPNKNYPQPMETNAIFFGGTDPGRFVPTYMIYSAHVRPDIYLITQNALADHTYMNVMRDLYGDQIWIPSPVESNMAFVRFQKEVGNGQRDGQKMQVQGVQNVMKINGYLSEMMFEHNQYRTETKTDEATRPVGSAVVPVDPVIDPQTGTPPRRAFYVEESYPMEWMYPYLTPHGLIMKVNNKKTPITNKMIKDDTEFWDWYCERLLNDDRFIRDICARKSFSKLRGSIASLYAARGKAKEAEYAYRQAIALYDLSPESNYRMAELLARENRYDEALEIFDVFMAKDPKNEQAVMFRKSLKQRRDAIGTMQKLEAKLKQGTLSFNEYAELASIYYGVAQPRRGDALMLHLLNAKGVTPEMTMQIADFMAKKQRLTVVEQALKKYTELLPEDATGWIQLAALQLMQNQRTKMWKSIDHALAVDAAKARQIIRNDAHFNAIRNTQQYKKRIPDPKQINLLPGF